MDPAPAPPYPPPAVPDPALATANVSAAAAVSTGIALGPASEAQNHVVHAASPTPGNLNHSHPPYSEMIFAAITALKEKNGSSKRAIAKYIERAYTGLPPAHSALLTHHLKRLKNSGLLVMVKKSYKLPRSDASPAAPPPGPPKIPGQGRGRGRPPKPKPIPSSSPEGNAQPVLVALGLIDDPNAQPVVVKRGPGRPRKNGPVGQGGPVKRGRGRPPGAVGVKPRLTKKTPKPKSVTAVLGPNGLKRGRGRPPKAQLQTMVIPFAPNNVPVVAPVPHVPRPRGRPKKDAAALGAAADGVVVAPKPRKSTGRPVGRPKKEKNAALAMPAPEMQPMAYVDLKRKLEYIQSKVKEVVDVLKPQITSESSVSVLSAIQELEGLVTMDIFSAPLQVESQQPQHPLPQQPPQPFPQQLQQSLLQQLQQPPQPQQHLPTQQSLPLN